MAADQTRGNGTPPGSGPDGLTNSQLRVLLVILRRRAQGLPVTLRDLAREVCGSTNHSAVVCHLHKLAGLGLVTWEPRRFATIRPLCRLTKV